MPISTNGLLVVRRPHWNFDPKGRGAFRDCPPELDGVYYSGIDRMPWFDVDEGLYDGTLPEDLRAIRKESIDSCTDFSGIEVVTGLADAKALLAHSNAREDRNEVVAVRSPLLEELKGTIPVPEHAVSWLGCDVVAFGEWSLLREGLFSAPECFVEWRQYLNAEGLLDLPEPAAADSFSEAYDEAAGKELVEKTAVGTQLLVVEIGRVVV